MIRVSKGGSFGKVLSFLKLLYLKVEYLNLTVKYLKVIRVRVTVLHASARRHVILSDKVR